jgi:hypothetical protein
MALWAWGFGLGWCPLIDTLAPVVYTYIKFSKILVSAENLVVAVLHMKIAYNYTLRFLLLLTCLSILTLNIEFG